MSDPANRQTLSYFRIAALLGASATVLIAVLGLMGWASKSPYLTSFGANYIPIASSTCIDFLIQGSALILLICRPLNARRWFFVRAPVALTSIFGMLGLIGYFVNVDLNFEAAIFPSSEKFTIFTVNRMSPFTGGLSCLTGAALLLLIRRSGKESVPRLAGTLGIAIALTGLTGIVGYVYGSPLLYTGAMIPMALPTNAAFMLLGIGLAAAAGSDGLILRSMTGNSIRAMLLRTFVPLGFLAVISSDILQRVVTKSNGALTSAASAVLFGMVAAIIAVFAARVIGNIIEKAEAERMRAEEALRRSEEKYRSIFENAVEGIYQSTPEGKFIEVNPAMARIFGYDSPEELQKAIDDIGCQICVDPARREEFIRAVQETGDAVFEIEILKKDGSTGWMSDSMRIVHDQNGKATHLEGIAEDITEYKRAEQEREELIAQLREALANVKTLSDLLPICSHCKKIRNDEGYWQQIESYIHQHSGTQFSHGICPECLKKHYSEFMGGKLDKHLEQKKTIDVEKPGNN
jgi:PAS domain S-box-containing protein